MPDTFDDVAKSKYILLTTFTKDGKPKPTAIWAARDGDKLLITTDDGSWKTKRIRNTPRVTIQKSSALGKPKGEPVEAVADPQLEARPTLPRIVVSRPSVSRMRNASRRDGGETPKSSISCSCGGNNAPSMSWPDRT